MYIAPLTNGHLLHETLSSPVVDNLKILSSAAILLLLTTDVTPKSYLTEIIDLQHDDKLTKDEISQPFATPLTYNFYVPPPILLELERKDHLVHTCGRVRHIITVKELKHEYGVSQKSSEWSEFYKRDVYIFRSLRK